MIRTLFDNNVFIYILLALTAVGLVMKLIVQILYFRLMRASESMGTSKNKLAQSMKKKFEAYYKLKLGVNNVDIFVDKHFFHYKFCGIFLSTWEVLCGQVLVLALLTGSISTILGLIYECGKNQILSTFSVGILSCGMLIFLEGAVNPSGKKEIIRLNMKDYLENILKARLVQEENQPELMEQYKKAYQPFIDLAASREQNRNEAPRTFQKKKKIKSREARRLEKMSQKARQKDEAAKKKEQAKLEKARQKMSLLEQKNIKKENKENSKLEKKLNAQKIKDAKAAEAAELKARKKEEIRRRKEDKIHQEEIKKALKLEKKAGGRSKKSDKTVAQEKKETLLREIQSRRKTEDEAEILKEELKETEVRGAAGEKTVRLSQDKLSEVTLPDGNSKESKKAESLPEKGIAPEKELAQEKENLTGSRAPEAVRTEAKVTGTKEVQVKPAQVRDAEVKAAEVSTIKTKPVSYGVKEDTHDDKIAAALEKGPVFRPTSEEEEKIIADILKDIFA